MKKINAMIKSGGKINNPMDAALVNLREEERLRIAVSIGIVDSVESTRVHTKSFVSEWYVPST